MTPEKIASWLNTNFPRRDWYMECQALVYRALQAVHGGEKNLAVHPTAMAAYRASRIVSTDPTTAPAGAIHYWANPAPYGHVAIGLGGEHVLMTGTPRELGRDGVMLGTNYGTTTVSSFMARGTQRYLGWSTTNGHNPTAIGKLAGSGTPTTNSAVAPEEEDIMDTRQLIAKPSKRRALFVPGTSYFVPWIESGATYANNFAKGLDTGSAIEVTDSLFDALQRGAAALLPRDRVAVEVVNAEAG